MGPRGTRLQESGEDYTTRRFIPCTPNQYYSGDHIKKNEMDGACGTHGGQENCVQGYCGRVDGKRPGVDGTMILKWIFGMGRPRLD